MKQKMNKYDNFDKYAKTYREIHSKNLKITGKESSYYAEHKVRTIKKVEKRENLKILDFGCGDGEVIKFFKKHFPKSKISGIDISDESIEKAKNKVGNTCNLKKYNGEKIPYKNESFDIVFVACVFHHINKKLHKKLFLEIKRVLKQSGKIYIFEHNPYNPVTRHLVNTCPFDEDAVLMSATYLKKLLKKIRFKQVKSTYVLFFPRNKIFSPFIQFEKHLEWIPLGGQYYVEGKK